MTYLTAPDDVSTGDDVTTGKVPNETATHGHSGATSGAVARAVRWHPPLMVFAAVMAGLALVATVGLFVDDREILGDPVWLKPLKFAISFVLYAVTLAWMISLTTRGRRIASWAGTAIALSGAVEVGLIVFQAARGRMSHFNETTELDATIWSLMGMTIAVLWTATLIVGLVLLFSPVRDRASRWAVRFGLATALLGMAVGMFMVMPTPEQAAADAAGMDVTIVGAHSVGVPDGGPGMPLTGWSLTGGDLRIPHFVGMHGLQALPLLAILLGALGASERPWAGVFDPIRRTRLIFIAAAAYASLVWLLTWQALRGQSLLSPDGLTIAAAGILAGATAIATIAALRHRGRQGSKSSVGQ